MCLADENLSLLRRIEELQSVDAHASKVKHDMRAFKAEYEKKFNSLHRFLESKGISATKDIDEFEGGDTQVKEDIRVLTLQKTIVALLNDLNKVSNDPLVI